MTTLNDLLKDKSSEVFSIQPDQAVYAAMELMATKEIGALVVLDDGDLVGIVSERDYARKVILQGKSSKSTHVSDIMTRPVIHVSPTQTVNECLQIMTQKRFRHLPVTVGGKVTAVVSIGDLVKAIIAEQQDIIEQLQHYITG